MLDALKRDARCSAFELSSLTRNYGFLLEYRYDYRPVVPV